MDSLDTRTMSQQAADEIARLEEVKAQWEHFESPQERNNRRVRQAQILGEAMLRIAGVRVPKGWHATMLAVADQYKTPKVEAPEGETPKDEQPESERWLVTREQLEADGWEFKTDSDGDERLFLPPNDLPDSDEQP